MKSSLVRRRCLVTAIRTRLQSEQEKVNALIDGVEASNAVLSPLSNALADLYDIATFKRDALMALARSRELISLSRVDTQPLGSWSYTYDADGNKLFGQVNLSAQPVVRIVCVSVRECVVCVCVRVTSRSHPVTLGCSSCSCELWRPARTFLISDAAWSAVRLPAARVLPPAAAAAAGVSRVWILMLQGYGLFFYCDILSRISSSSRN